MENTNMPMPPKNYLVESILVTLFCCLPFGIAGIIYASKVEGLHRAGDIAGAQEASANAKKWMRWGLIGGIITIVLTFVFYGAIIATILNDMVII